MIFCLVLLLIYLKGLDKEILRWIKYGRFPIIDIVMILSGFFAADFVEHHTHGYFASYQDLFEELFELVMYGGMLSLFTNIGFNKNFHPDENVEKSEAGSKVTYI